jgi:hypothetical protein
MTTTDDTSRDPLPSALDRPGPLANLRIGLSVLAGELQWTLLKWLRIVEIRQLHKRLRQEYGHLGHAVHDSVEADASLAQRQIDFLQAEIDYLRLEMERKRAEFLSRRLRRLTSTR